jgi:predicted adenine nucleotide alpha hydrolase (AANH) superfamily ATPase
LSRILLHTCCAPCTTYVNKWLGENGFEVKGLFYNPNIRPQEEYERRLLTMEYYATAVGLKVIYESFLEDERPPVGKCEICYKVRMRKAAEWTKKLGFEAFTTTLFISPYQKHDLLKEIGEEISSEFGVEFFYHDFSVGYRESIKTSKEIGLYRQKYCGCGVELAARKEKAHAKAG